MLTKYVMYAGINLTAPHDPAQGHVPAQDQGRGKRGRRKGRGSHGGAATRGRPP